MNSYMRALVLFFAACLMAGCASQPEYYISPAPVTIPKTATYWLDTLDVEVVGKNERFLSDEKVRKALGVDMVNRLLEAGRYATSKDKADYLLDMSIVYTRHIQDSKGGLATLIVDDNKLLLSVDFSYKVTVKKNGAEVLHFSKALYDQVPGGVIGNFEQYKTMGALVTNNSNSSVEGFYFRVYSRDIVNDIRDIPTR
jgi:hypothetical protein